MCTVTGTISAYLEHHIQRKRPWIRHEMNGDGIQNHQVAFCLSVASKQFVLPVEFPAPMWQLYTKAANESKLKTQNDNIIQPLPTHPKKQIFEIHYHKTLHV